MKRGTPEYNEYMQQVCKRADERLAAAYRTYLVRDLDHDWRCNISAGSRKILLAEYHRRGLQPLPPPTNTTPVEAKEKTR